MFKWLVCELGWEREIERRLQLMFNYIRYVCNSHAALVDPSVLSLLPRRSRFTSLFDTCTRMMPVFSIDWTPTHSGPNKLVPPFVEVLARTWKNPRRARLRGHSHCSMLARQRYRTPFLEANRLVISAKRNISKRQRKRKCYTK